MLQTTKKIISIMLCIIMIFGLVACGSNNENGNNSDENVETTIDSNTDVTNDSENATENEEESETTPSEPEIPEDVKYNSGNLQVVLDNEDFKELNGKIIDIKSFGDALDTVLLEESLADSVYTYTEGSTFPSNMWAYKHIGKYDAVLDMRGDFFAISNGDVVTIFEVWNDDQTNFERKMYSLNAECNKDEFLHVFSIGYGDSCAIFYVRNGVLYFQKGDMLDKSWEAPVEVKCDINGEIYPVTYAMPGNYTMHIIVNGNAYDTEPTYLTKKDHILLTAITDKHVYNNVEKIIHLSNADTLCISTDDNQTIYCGSPFQEYTSDGWKDEMGIITMPEGYFTNDIDEIYLSFSSTLTVKMKDGNCFYVKTVMLPDQSSEIENLIPVEGVDCAKSTGKLVRVLPSWSDDALFLMDDGYLYKYVD